MGFLRDQRTKWRARHHSSCEGDATANATAVSSSAPPTPSLPLEPIAFPYSGGPLGLTLQRSKSPWVDDIGPTKLAWHKDRRLGITFHEKPARAGGVDPAIAIKELADDARSHPAVCVGMELIGVNGEPVAGVPLATVMDIIRSSESPCELAFTPPPSPILVAEVLSAAAAQRGITNGHVLVAVDDAPMLGCSLQDASDAIGAATPDAPVTLRFAPLHVVFQGRGSDADAAPRSNESAKRSLRNTLCIAAVAAALTV